MAAGGAGSRGGRSLRRRAGLEEGERGRLAGFGVLRLVEPEDVMLVACGLGVLEWRPGVLVSVECSMAQGACVCVTCRGLWSG